MDQKPFINVEQLSKSFKVPTKSPGIVGSIKGLFAREYVTKAAVQEVSFKIHAGEIVGLIGANGAGKTTIVKCLAGIIKPDTGLQEVLGYNPWDHDPHYLKQIALVMGQKAQLWWDLPAADCFLLLKEIYQLSDADYKSQLELLVESLGVADQLRVQVRRLSLGERMKMELIAALLHRPKVLFLDEPTIGLDLNAQNAIRRFLMDYKANNQVAMILTSHYMEDIERLCKRILLIREGHIIYDGPLQDVLGKWGFQKTLRVQAEGIHLWSEGSKYGKLESPVANEISLQLPRQEIAAATSEIIARFDVKDLSIVEQDIAEVIATIMKDGIAT